MPPLGRLEGAVYMIETAPLLSARNRLGVLVIGDGPPVSVPMAEPPCVADVVSERLIAAPGMPPPEPFSAVTVKVLLAPAARLPVAAIGGPTLHT